MFLHLVSAMDSDVLAEISTVRTHELNYSHRDANRDLNDRGFMTMYNECQVESAKCLLFLFSISHIVVVHTPSLQFDTSSLNLFKIIESGRDLVKPYICEALKKVDGLPRDWIETGRPCSPRVLFAFEPVCNTSWMPSGKGSGQGSSDRVIEEITANRRKYELKLEDQIYRFMRRCRIITNICSNSLFAICNQMDFVFLSTNSNSIKDPQSYLNHVLLNFCSKETDRRRFGDAVGGDGLRTSSNRGSIDSDRGGYGGGEPSGRNQPINEEEHTFYNFLFNHINTAHSKGFDDNVGRHNVIAVFEKPTVDQFFKVLTTLRGLFFPKLNSEAVDKKKDASYILSKYLKSMFESESLKFADIGTRSKVLVY